MRSTDLFSARFLHNEPQSRSKLLAKSWPPRQMSPGIWFKGTFTRASDCRQHSAQKNLNPAINYEPRVGDLIIASFPKTGTTWMQYIASLIFNSGEPPKGPIMFGTTPFLELVGSDGVLEYMRPVPIKTHLTVQSDSIFQVCEVHLCHEESAGYCRLLFPSHKV